MTTIFAPALTGGHGNEVVTPETELEPLAKLRARAQFVRIAGRYKLSAFGAGCVYIVAKGVVGLDSGVPSVNTRAITGLLYTGDILVPDLQAPMDKVSLVTQRPAEFWKLTSAAFGEATARDHQLWQTVFDRLNDQNARAQLHISEMSLLNSEERVAAFLIEVAARLGVASGGVVTFDLPLSRYSIADYLSLNADTISRTFSKLIAGNILTRRGRFNVTIRDWPELLRSCPMSEAILRTHGKPELIR